MADEKKILDQQPKISHELKWMIRPCDAYDEEYRDCKSIKAKFHQYFIHGETTDCEPWNTDYKRCLRWRDDEDNKAYEELVASEQKRRADRLLPHFKNDTWKRRTSPPADWNRPLPAWLEEENKNTLLSVKAEEAKLHGKPLPGERSLCVIS